MINKATKIASIPAAWIGPDGKTVVNGLYKSRMSQALDVLRSYPQDSLVSELYDVDDDKTFADALNRLFPDSFEYPDYSHRKIGEVVKSVMKRNAEVSQVQARDHLSDKYAESIIGDQSDRYDVLEVHGVRDLNEQDDQHGTQFEIDNENPQTYSVYAHIKGDDGIECVGDFGEHEMAVTYASQLSAKYGWAVHDFSKAGKEQALAIEKSRLDNASISDQFAPYKNLPVARAYLQQIINRSDPDRFHFTEIDTADVLVAMYADTPLEKTVFSLDEDAHICPENATAYAARARREGLDSLLVMPRLDSLCADSKVGTLTNENLEPSRSEAEIIAKVKEKHTFVDAQFEDQSQVGKVMGVTDRHVVLSLGRSAMIYEKTMLDRVPAINDEVIISLKNGMGHVSDCNQEKGASIGR